VQVRADIDALRPEAGLGDRRVSSLEVRSGDLMPGALGGAKETPQPAGWPLGEVALERAASYALL
jgi:hypothetical protein